MEQLKRTLIKYVPIWINLTERNILSYTRGSYLGIVWTILFPLLQMFIFLSIMSSLFSSPKIDLFYSVAPGIFAWNFFVKATSMLCVCVDSASIKMTAVPNIIFPLSRLLDDFPTLIVGILIIIGVRTYFVHLVPMEFVVNSLLFFLLYIPFVLGIGLVLCSLQVFFRDISYIWGLICQTGIFITPVFFPEAFITESKYWYLLQWNPLFYFLKMFREPLTTGSVASTSLVMICGFLSLCSVALGFLTFTKLNKHFINHI